MIPVLLVAGLLLVIAQLHRSSGSVIASELNRLFELDAATIGLVMGAMFLASAVVQIPVGLAFDRFGTRRTVTALGGLALLGTLVFGLSDGAWGLALGRFLIGSGFGGTITAIFLLAMRWAPPERFTTVAATVIALGSALGGLLATAPLALMLAAVGWRTTFITIGALTLISTLLYHLIVRDAPRETRSRSSIAGLREGLAGLRAVVADPTLRRMLAMGATFIAPFATVTGLWASPYLQDVHGLAPASASYVLFAMVATYNLGTLAYGLLDRWTRGRKPVVMGGALTSALVMAVLVVWPAPPVALAVLMLVLFAAANPYYVVLTAHCREFVPVERTGRAITTLNLCGLGGAFVAQWVSGLLVAASADSTGLGSSSGYRAVFALIALSLLVALAIYRKVPERPG